VNLDDPKMKERILNYAYEIQMVTTRRKLLYIQLQELAEKILGQLKEEYHFK
jgi:hypothetical protein